MGGERETSELGEARKASVEVHPSIIPPSRPPWGSSLADASDCARRGGKRWIRKGGAQRRRRKAQKVVIARPKRRCQGKNAGG